MKVIIQGLTNFSTSTNQVDILWFYYDGAGGGDPGAATISLTGLTTLAQLNSQILAAIISDASGRSISITVDDIVWVAPSTSPVALKNAPQAAIANAPADATTTYNVVTTLLGSLTGAVNTANAKQNDIATKLNSVLAALRTVGIIVT